MIKLIENADLLACNADYICHQANCISQNAAGLAYHIFKKFPYADVYKDRCNHQTDKPGINIIKGDGKKQRYIVNMMSQYYPGKSQNCFDGPKYGNEYPDTFIYRLMYFTQCLDLLVQDLSFSDDYGSKKITIAFPFKIGCN